ncbi:MAG: FitA-like ribbon-helix-helix domain-containing protein [Nocardioidaceae bacterium]
MPNVLVRGLSADTHGALLRRAEANGQSLQQYLAVELTRLAVTPTMAEVLGRVDQRSGGRIGFDVALNHLADERSRR